MNNKLLCFGMFVAGAIVGSVATWYYTKGKYEAIAEEEINSVKETFSNKEKNLEEKIEDHKAYIDLTSKYDQARYSTKENKEVKIVPEDKNYAVISPDEFGEIEDYDTITLFHWADGYLSDDMNELVDGIDEAVGNDYDTHFGEYEDDSVFVRNDARRCYYEILLETRNYSDVVK